MSFCDVSLLCFEGCVNAINGFIEKGTEHHTRIAKARRGLIIIMIKINWKFSGLWNLKRRGVLKCNIATLRRQRKSEPVIHEFWMASVLNLEFLFVYREKIYKTVDFTPNFLPSHQLNRAKQMSWANVIATPNHYDYCHNEKKILWST